MKDNPNLEELLNGYVDDELNERQRIELRRLVSHDTDAARKLEQLRRCKMLVSCLPASEAPADMLERVKSCLEKRALVGRQVSQVNEQAGARQLLFRKILTAAAMIGLVALLGTVIYTIVGPEDTTKRVVQDQPRVKAGTSTFANDELTVAPEKAVARFDGRLELSTTSSTAAEAVVKGIQANGLLVEFGPVARLTKGSYSVRCSGSELELLLDDLESIWHEFDSATLFFDSDTSGATAVVEGVTIDQVNRIINQSSLSKRVEVARDIAVLNNVARRMPARDYLEAVETRIPPLTIIPKPRLTGDEATIKKTIPTEKQRNVHLTILVNTPQIASGDKAN